MMRSLEWLEGFAEGLRSAEKFAGMAPADKTAKDDIGAMIRAGLLSAEVAIQQHPDSATDDA